MSSSNRTLTQLLLYTLLFSFLLFHNSLTAAEDSKESEASIRTLIDKTALAFANEDYEGVLQSFHSDSPKKSATKKALSDMFKTYDLQFTITDFKFIGEDGEYAFARMKEISKRKMSSQGEFMDNTSDSLYVFKKEGNHWKIWDELILDTKFHKEKASDS